MSTTYQRGNQQRNGQSQGPASTVTDERVDAAKRKLESMKHEMVKVAGPLVDPDELVRFTLNAGIKNKKLFECFDSLPGTASVFLSIITSRIIGIPCDGIHAYLVPFKDNKQEAVICQLIIGYKGFVQLALANPNVATFNAQPVFDDDKFAFEYGTDAFLRHRPSDKKHDDNQLTHAYAIYSSTKGGKDFRVLSKPQIDKRRAVSKAKDDGPWQLWYPEMAAKTAILSLAKVAPLGQKVQLASRVTERIESFGSLTASDVTDLRGAADTKGIEYAPQEPAFIPPTEDTREKVPNKQRSRQSAERQAASEEERVTLAGLMDQINHASANQLNSVQEQINREADLGTFDQGELDNLTVAMQERRRSLNAR